MSRIGLSVLIAAFAPLAFGGTFLAFGPETFQEGGGKPVPRNFAVLDPTAAYTLRVDNSGVTSGEVRLNGATILATKDFGGKPAVIEKPVTLLANNQLIVSIDAPPSASFSLRITGIDNVPPTITATVSPTPNPAGWHKSNPTVTFTCSDATSGIQFCPAPVTVTTEGANQVVSGTARDKAGNAATASVTIKLDKTLPTVAVTSPSDGATVGTPSITLNGTATDSLSGISGVTCKGAPAAISGSNFTCTVALVQGPNSIPVQAADIAGNVAFTTITVTFVPLQITDFNPKSASIGALVNVTGGDFTPSPGTAVQVSLNKLGGGAIDAPVASSSATSLSFVIPAGAATGPIIVKVNSKMVTSGAPLTILPSASFTLTALPAAADLIQGQTASYALTLGSSSAFSQLAALSLSGLPSGVTASFKPQSVTAGQTSVVTLTAPVGQALGQATLTFSAAATVDGIPLSQSATAQLNIVAPTTTFLGRTVVDDALQTPLAGVTVTMLGKNGSGGTTGCTGSAVSDAAGNFALRSLPATCVGQQLVGFDGTTATSPPGDYAGVNLVYTFVSGQVTTSPVLVHLPRIDNKETFFVQQNASVDQSYSYRSIPGLSVTVYRGTTFTMPDGSQPNPFPLVAVQVPVDRLPDAKPPVPTMLLVFIVAFQPANARASQPGDGLLPQQHESSAGDKRACHDARSDTRHHGAVRNRHGLGERRSGGAGP